VARSKNLMAVAALLFAAACGDDTTPGSDAGPRSDSGPSFIDGGPRPDTGPRPDSGGGGEDECATDQETSADTVGCNGGWDEGEPAANAPLGACTVEDGGTAGTCTGENAFCAPLFGGVDPVCWEACSEADTYVSTGECPSGYRCFTLEGGALCFRDCDDEHACPDGWECDGEGSCLPAGEPEGDAGVPDGDGGVPEGDGGGLTLPDASVELPDATVTLPDAG
jgi:hypothetical protein